MRPKNRPAFVLGKSSNSNTLSGPDTTHFFPPCPLLALAGVPGVGTPNNSALQPSNQKYDEFCQIAAHVAI